LTPSLGIGGLIRTTEVTCKLVQNHCKCNFTNGVIPIWNVVSAETIDIFKRRLDKF